MLRTTGLVMAAALSVAPIAALAQPKPQPPTQHRPMPTSDAMGPELLARMRAALAEKGPDYVPRTHLLYPDGAPKRLNRLILETSPYLVQHAHNPVDWRPWGPEAMAAAKAADKPIFLSVGYATCHWCHVMEAESFDQEDVAAILNRDFISVKLDREQRPHIDQTYMIATMMMTGRGGWPNSVWLTPDGEPFYAGTYFPKETFLQVLDGVTVAWRERRDEIDHQADRVAAAIQGHLTQRAAAAEVGPETRAATLASLSSSHNAVAGGFSIGAQFPNETHLLFLLDQWRRTGSDAALEMALRTLDAIEAGAIHDQIGGGFHRYAVDVDWRTPHFEKMLYTQALLARAYVEAWEATGLERYARAARRALDYTLRDMRARDGAFFAAEDAESVAPESSPYAGERVEGAFYAWSAADVRAILGDEAEAAISALSLNAPATIAAGAAPRLSAAASRGAARASLDAALAQLQTARAERPRPLRDEKIIAGWNGLTIRALATAGAAFDEPVYVEAAARAAQAIWSTLWDEESGVLLRLYVDERPAPLPGVIEDYAWLALGYVALWDATGDPEHLDRAARLSDEIVARFESRGGRFRMSEAMGPLGPTYQTEDGATPAGESSALELFAALAHRAPTLTHEERGLSLLAALSGMLVDRPMARTTAQRAAAILQEGESGYRRPSARGALRVTARREGRSARIQIAFADGWHVNAHTTLQDELIPTELTGARVVSVAYPPATTRTLGFQDAPVALFEGNAEIVATLAADGPAVVTLTAQACSDRVCLAPEDLTFRLP